MEELNTNSGKTKTIIIVLLSILCLIFLIYIIYMLANKNSETTKEEPKKQDTEVILKETTKRDLARVNSKLTEQYLTDTIEIFNSPFANRSKNLNNDIYGYYYRRNKVIVEELGDFVLAYIGLYHHTVALYQRSDLTPGKQMCVSRDTIHNIVRSKFRNLNFKDLGPNEEILVYGDTYKFKIDEYCAFIAGGRGGPNESIENLITGYKEFDDKIEVYTKAIFLYFENAEAMGHLPIVTKFYKDVDRISLVLEKDDTFDVKNLTKEELDKFDTYKFTYNKDKEDVYFYSVEKVI